MDETTKATTHKKADIQHAIVFAALIKSLEDACALAGGGSWWRLKDLTLEHVAHILAPNGIRFIYVDSGTVDGPEVAALADQMASALPHLPTTQPKNNPTP